MKSNFDFYENIYSKDSLKKYTPLITEIYSGNFAFFNKQKTILKDFENMLNDIAKIYLSKYLSKQQVENFEIIFENTNYSETGRIGYTNTDTQTVHLSSDYLYQCLLLRNTATPIGATIHECTHLIQSLAYNYFSDENRPINAYCFDMQKWLEDDWYKNTYNSMVKNVVIPYINSVQPDKKLNFSSERYLPSKILYTHDNIEIEANIMQSHLQRRIGSIFDEITENLLTKKKISNNFFSTKNNFSGQIQSFNNNIKTKNYDFIEAVINLTPKDFANMLPHIENYSKKFVCKTPTAIKSERFANFLKYDCIENFILIYYGNSTEKKYKDFIAELKKLNNQHLVCLAEKVENVSTIEMC